MKHTRMILYSLLLLTTMLACSAVSNLMATPTPVSTVTPIPTITAIPSIPAPSVFFEDSEFTNSCSTESTSDVERFVENGQFHMLVKTPKYLGWTECTKVEFSDLILEVDATQVAGSNNNTYGVIFRYGLDNDEFYVFAISGDGSYTLTIDGVQHTEPDIIVDWTKTSTINQGQQTNRIKVVAFGQKIEYYINDQLLGEAQNERLASGTVGFFAGSYDEGGIHISFDNLKISNP